MTSNLKVNKNLTSKSNLFLFGLISFFVIALILSVKTASAYYYNSTDNSIISNQVGDFEINPGDINMVVYLKNNSGKYIKVSDIPGSSYTFKDSLTTCVNPDNDAVIACNNNNGNCNYSFNTSTRKFSLTSNQKILCSFYFE